MQKNNLNSMGGLWIIAIPTLLVILAFTLWLLFRIFITPIINYIQIKNWVEIPCTIINSEISPIPKPNDIDGPYIPPNFTFKYKFNDKWYEGKQFDFSPLWLNNSLQEDNEVLSNLPVGSQTTCFVNQNNPSLAILDKLYLERQKAHLWIPAIFFLMISLLCLFLWYRKKVFFKNKKILFNRYGTNWARFRFSALLVLISSSTLFSILMFIPFEHETSIFDFKNIHWSNYLLIGVNLLLIFNSIYRFILVFLIPEYFIELLDQNITLGRTLKFHYFSKNNIRRIKKLKISLKCSETYYSGDEMASATVNILFDQELLNTEKQNMIGSATISFKMPRDQSPTTSTTNGPLDNSGVRWEIILEGEIEKAKKLNASFLIKVGSAIEDFDPTTSDILTTK